MADFIFTLIILGLIYMTIGLCVEYALHLDKNPQEPFKYDWKVISLWIKRII